MNKTILLFNFSGAQRSEKRQSGSDIVPDAVWKQPQMDTDCSRSENGKPYDNGKERKTRAAQPGILETSHNLRKPPCTDQIRAKGN